MNILIQIESLQPFDTEPSIKALAAYLTTFAKVVPLPPRYFARLDPSGIAALVFHELEIEIVGEGPSAGTIRTILKFMRDVLRRSRQKASINVFVDMPAPSHESSS